MLTFDLPTHFYCRKIGFRGRSKVNIIFATKFGGRSKVNTMLTFDLP